MPRHLVACALKTTTPDIVDSQYGDLFELNILAGNLADAATADQNNDKIIRINKTRDSLPAWSIPPQQKPTACTIHSETQIIMTRKTSREPTTLVISFRTFW
jgi:hypothetical protein